MLLFSLKVTIRRNSLLRQLMMQHLIWLQKRLRIRFIEVKIFHQLPAITIVQPRRSKNGIISGELVCTTAKNLLSMYKRG